ncbi:hypothetical protein L9F63_010657, partial [Diploptera punctata]
FFFLSFFEPSFIEDYPPLLILVNSSCILYSYIQKVASFDEIITSILAFRLFLAFLVIKLFSFLFLIGTESFSRFNIKNICIVSYFNSLIFFM